MYAPSILIWECVCVIASCMIYLLCIFDFKRALGLVPALFIAVFQYFLVSFVGSLVKDSIENVGISLYASKWYLLNVTLKKEFIRVFVVAVKTKTFTVGPFELLTLERYRKVCKIFCNIYN